MTTGAIYLKATGLIQQTIAPPLTNPEQLVGLEAAGLSQTIIPDGKNGSTGMIDLASGQYVDYAPAPPPVPNVLMQYIAAQINAGTISASQFHPTTLTDLNNSLSAANMNTVSPAATVSANTPDDSKT